MKKSLYFWRHGKWQNFRQKLFQYDSFWVKKWGKLERARRYVYKNLLNLDCQDSIHFGIFQVA